MVVNIGVKCDDGMASRRIIILFVFILLNSRSGESLNAVRSQNPIEQFQGSKIWYD